MERYILDISGALLPRWFKKNYPLEIPLVLGEHMYDFDVVMHELPYEFFKRLCHCLLHAERPCFEYLHGDEVITRPLGVDKIAAEAAGCEIRKAIMPKVHNKHHRTAGPDAIYIGRGSPYGNPFVTGKHGDRDEVCDRYEAMLKANPQLVAKVKAELKGKDLVCFCAPKRCHGDTLLLIANDAQWRYG